MKRLIVFLFAFCSMLPAAGVAISTITCSGQTVTVNGTALGIAASQGFSITGSSVSAYNINSTAKTASANTFTFLNPTGTSCSGSASGGTVTPAKQIIDISSAANPGAGNPGNGLVTISYVNWFTTWLPVPLACPGVVPVCPVSLWSGASAAENAAIVAGTTVEIAGTITVAANTSSTSIQSNAVTQYAAMQVGYAAGLLSGAGFWYNGTAWVNQ